MNEIKKLLVVVATQLGKEFQQDSLFKQGFGYITVFPHQDLEENIIHSYYINTHYYTLKEEAPDNTYPMFYTKVDGRLVFIRLRMYDGFICFKFSEKSKRKLRKLQQPFLIKSQDITIRDESGKKLWRDKNFRIEPITLHSGKELIIYTDKEPEIIRR